MKRRALITGVTGQDGSYLAELLLAKGYEVFGLVRRSSTTNLQRIAHLLGRGADRVHLVLGDVTDAASLRAAVSAARPDEVYSLAAQSHVQVSFEVPEATADVTGMGVLRLLQAVRDTSPQARFFHAGSSEQFGRVRRSPQTEETPFHPRSPYACAKVFAYHVTRNYREAYGMFAANGIFFNHESPRRGEDFVTRKIALAARAIAAGEAEQLSLGNLEARRDWGFAGDYVEAMWRILQAADPEDYVVATGESHSVREFCERAFELVGLPLTWHGSGLKETGRDPQGQVRVKVDPKYFRPSEVDDLKGDASKIRKQLGWEPKTGFEELVRMMVG